VRKYITQNYTEITINMTASLFTKYLIARQLSQWQKRFYKI